MSPFSKVNVEIEREKIMDIFLENLPCAIGVLDRKMNYMQVNRLWLNYYQLDRQDAISKSHYDIFPNTSKKWKKIYQSSLKGQVHQGEEQVINPIKKTVDWMKWEIRPWQEATGKIGGIVTFAEFISDGDRGSLELEYKKTTAALEESEERFKIMADSAPVLIWMSDTNAARNFFNQTWLTFTGRKILEEIGNGWTENIYPEDLDLCINFYWQNFANRLPFSREYRLKRADGQYRWILDKGVPRFSANGVFAGYVGSCIDITEIKETQSQLDYRLKFEQLISALSTYFINLPLEEIDRGIHDFLKTIGEFFDIDRNYIFLFDRGNKITNIYEWNVDLAYPCIDLNKKKFFDSYFYSLFDKLNNLKILKIENIADFDAQDIISSNYFKENSLNALTIVPIINKKSLIGAIQLEYSSGKISNNDNNIILLGLLAETIANAIERKYSEEERLRIEQLLFQEKEIAQITLQSIGDGVITTNFLGKIQYLNPVAERLTGWKLSEAKERLLSEVFKINEQERELSNSNLEINKSNFLTSYQGVEYAIDFNVTPMQDRQGKIIGNVIIFRDVTESRNLANKLSWQATHDDLTGLINRREFNRQIVEAIQDVKKTDKTHVLCYLDLDRFKIINDTCGHIAGDELLRQITSLFKQRVRNSDTIARIGGDEFGLLLNRCSATDALKIAESIRQLVYYFRFNWQNQVFSISISIGLVEINEFSQDLCSVLNAVDAACYMAKEQGRNSVHLYKDVDGELAKQQTEKRWIFKIERSLEENRFCLYYQKIISIDRAGDTEHYEVLLRLIDENGSIVAPMAFIPIAERYDLMPAIDCWVVSNFFAHYERYSQENPQISNYLYTINLSGASVNSGKFFDFLKEQFDRYNISPKNVCFEITETAAIANLNRAGKLIEQIKELGCRFALDDFGKGMSSLAYLKHLPVDYLKIDGSFVKNITNDAVDLAIVECFNRIGHSIAIETIAEFVENEQILAKLKEIGVNYAQGYGISKPCPLFSD
jgi:diguanylate cyclase (GGDEF)-like protein/PAS domain S-box-containing protein